MIKNYTSVKACLFFVLVGLITLAGCKKSSTTTQSIGNLSMVNASPTSATYDVYADDVKMNGAALPFGGQIKYLPFLSGDHTFRFTVAGRGETLFTKTTSIAQNAYVSFYLINRASSFDAFVVSDDLSASSTDKAFVRLVHVSPDAPAMDLAVKGGSAIFTGKAYKTSSGFAQLSPAKQTYEIKDANGVVKATLTDITFTAGRYYTILVSGFVTPANSEEKAFNAQVILHQ